MDDSPILLTGAAGFIGAHVMRALQARGERVVGQQPRGEARADQRLRHQRRQCDRREVAPGGEKPSARPADRPEAAR